MIKLTELSWTLLIDKPVILQDQQTGTRLCCWAGVPMDFKTGLVVFGQVMCNIHNRNLQLAAANDFQRAHILGFFDHNIAAEYPPSAFGSGVISLMNSRSPGIFNRVKQYHPKEILECFMPKNLTIHESTILTKENDHAF